MPRYSEKKKQALEALLRDEIYRTAVEIVTRDGLQALTMDQVARGVGVSRGTIYNHFADRDAVVDYLEERTFGPVLDELERIAGREDDAEGRLTSVASCIFDSVHEDFSLIIALVPDKNSTANQEKQQRRERRALSAIESILRDGISEGLFHELPVAETAEFFLYAVFGKIEAMAMRSELQPASTIVPSLMKLFLGGLRRAC